MPILGACRGNAGQLDRVLRSALIRLCPREFVAHAAVFNKLHRFIEFRRCQRLDVQRRGSNVVFKAIRVAKDMAVNDLVLLLNASAL